MAKEIVVVGSSNTDMILKLARLPGPGETILGGDFFVAAGGKGANQAVSAARAGASVAFIARVGRDAWGDQSINGFVKDGIDVGHLIRDDRAPSGVALIFVAANGENCIGVASGANANLSAEDVIQARDIISNAKALLMQLETPIETLRVAAKLAAEKGVRVILNPAPAQPLGGEILKNVSILTPNESEAEILTGVKITNRMSMRRAAAALMSRGVKAVVITLGRRGAYVSSDGADHLVPPFEVEGLGYDRRRRWCLTARWPSLFQKIVISSRRPNLPAPRRPYRAANSGPRPPPLIAEKSIAY